MKLLQRSALIVQVALFVLDSYLLFAHPRDVVFNYNTTFVNDLRILMGRWNQFHGDARLCNLDPLLRLLTYRISYVCLVEAAGFLSFPLGGPSKVVGKLSLRLDLHKS